MTAYTSNKLIFTQMKIYVCVKAENIVDRGENAGYQDSHADSVFASLHS